MNRFEKLSRQVIYGSPEQRKEAAAALGEYKTESAARALLRASRYQDAELRQIIAKSLGQIGHPCAVPSLFAAMKEKAKGVRRRNHDFMESPDQRRRDAARISAVEELNQFAYDSLIAMGDSAAEHLIPELWDIHISNELKNKIIKILGEGCTRAPKELIEALKNEDNDEKLTALNILVKINDPTSLTAIINVFDNNNTRWHSTPNGVKDTRLLAPAAEFMGRNMGIDAIPYVRSFMRDINANVRQAVFSGFSKATPKNVSELRKLQKLILELRATKDGEGRGPALENAKELSEIYQKWAERLHEKLAKENEGKMRPPKRFRVPLCPTRRLEAGTPRRAVL